jgi:OOP family OmpA-OmpF porin
MKKLILMAAIGTILTAPLTALAEGEGPYAGLGLGRAYPHLDFDDPTITTLSRSRGTAFTLYGGYDFNRFFALEGGYANEGPSKDTYSSGETISYHFSSYYIAGKGTLPLGPFRLFAKLGVTNNRIAGSDNFAGGDYPFNGGKVDVMGGFGAGFYFTKNIGVQFQYEDFGTVNSIGYVNGGAVDIHAKGRMWSAGLNYKF